MNKTITISGIPEKYPQENESKFQQVLANLQIFSQNVKGFHWNLVGEQFFEMHKQFDELYTYLSLTIDTMAERIRALDLTPIHDFETSLKTSQVKIAKDISDPKLAAAKVLEAFKIVIASERELLAVASENNDEATVNMLGDFVQEQEKQAWMYNSYLK